MPELYRPEDDLDWDHPLTSPIACRSDSSPAEFAELGSPTDRPPSPAYFEVERFRERVQAIDWEPAPSEPSSVCRTELSTEQWSLIEGLFELRVLTGTQIHREFLTSIGYRQASRVLSRLRAAGVIRRGRFYPAKVGRAEGIYVLDGKGFALLREAPDHPVAGWWSRSLPRGAQHTVHDLIRNDWLFAFRSLAPRQLLGFRGTRRGKIEVPFVVGRPGAPKRPLKQADLFGRPPIGLLGKEFSNIVPDLTLELLLESGGEERRIDLLVEIERRNNNEDVWNKALAYDGLLNGWWEEHARYGELGRPPMVVFVVSDLRHARRFITLFDRALQGHQVVPPHTQTRAENEQGLRPTAKRLYFGRERIFVAVARDVHQRTLRAWRVPADPPDQRACTAEGSAEGTDASRPVPRVAQLLDRRGLVDPAT